MSKKNYDSIREALQFSELTPEEKEQRGILCRLYGPCASIEVPTRNGRFYSESLWNNVFNSELVKEMFANGGVVGELDHPTDREETCSDRIAVIMPEVPKKDKDGHLICYLDVIDTPTGRIVYQLAKYGYKLGISSRGSGDIIEGIDGEEVDPSTYEFKGFDIVLIPAVKEARLEMTESLDGKTFKQAINESIERSTGSERKIMQEALAKLNIDYSSEKRDNIEADDDGLSVVKELQKSLRENKILKKTIADLQEKLSVCYAKEAKQKESVEVNNQTRISLTESEKQNEDLKVKVNSLTEQLNTSTSEREDAVKKFDSMRKANSLLLKKSSESKRKIDEALKKKDDEMRSLKKELSSIKESLNEELKNAKAETKSLKEEIESEREEHKKQISEANKASERYKDIARLAVERYIANKANMLSVSPRDIKEKLSKGYSFSDIDRVCESIQGYQVKMNQLPFKAESGARISIRESNSMKLNRNYDDDIDQSLIDLVNVYK